MDTTKSRGTICYVAMHCRRLDYARNQHFCTWTMQTSTFTISYPQSATTYMFVAANNTQQLANLHKLWNV